MKNRIRQRDRGTVLIFALWAIALLSILSISVGALVRQKILLVQRLQERNSLYFIADAGIRKAIAILHSSTIGGVPLTPAEKKARYFNNKTQLGRVEVDRGSFSVRYRLYRNSPDTYVDKYGFMDEEAKLNINHATQGQLRKLLEAAFELTSDEARDVAGAILDWRMFGKSELTGFFDQDYYENLDYPYEPKDGDYEVIDELMLVKGIDEGFYQRLRNFVTVYGDGKVNINTASEPVLLALGLTPELVSKIIVVRNGRDGIYATLDDHVFLKTDVITNELASRIKLEDEEIQQLLDLNIQGKITTRSQHYVIKSIGRLTNINKNKVITCIYNTNDNRIIYWREL